MLQAVHLAISVIAISFYIILKYAEIKIMVT